MADIIIRGMKMPKNCWDCPFVNTNPCPCKGYSTALEHVTDRHEYCPIVELLPHGRLIDADEADDYAYDELEVSNSYLSPREASRNMQLIYKNMPTIIPASEEVENGSIH